MYYVYIGAENLRRKWHYFTHYNTVFEIIVRLNPTPQIDAAPR
jgi:hypothetical protein